ncbi:MAG: hypothetical protein WAU78_18665, partial [Roseiarcus sp.]
PKTFTIAAGPGQWGGSRKRPSGHAALWPTMGLNQHHELTPAESLISIAFHAGRRWDPAPLRKTPQRRKRSAVPQFEVWAAAATHCGDARHV